MISETPAHCQVSFIHPPIAPDWSLAGGEKLFIIWAFANPLNSPYLRKRERCKVKILHINDAGICGEGQLQFQPVGEVAEWSIATVLKTVDPQGSVGSNPTLSATQFATTNPTLNS